MRRYKGGRGARRGRRAPTQWVCSEFGWPFQASSSQFVPFQWTGGIVGGTLGIPQSFELVGATANTSDFDPPIIQRFTIQTIVGQIHFSATSVGAAEQIMCYCGIILGDVTQAGTATPRDPASNGDAGAPWMFIRTYFFAASAVKLSAAQPTPEDVLVKSKRCVREGQRITLYMNVLSNLGVSGSNAVVSITPALRTLIKRVA